MNCFEFRFHNWKLKLCRPAAVLPVWHCLHIEQWLNCVVKCVLVCASVRETWAPQSLLLWWRAHWGTMRRKESQMKYQLFGSHGCVWCSNVSWALRWLLRDLRLMTVLDYVCGRRHVPTVLTDWCSAKWPQQLFSQITLIWATSFPGFEAYVY